MRVEQFYNKNQFVIRGEGKTVFQSYNSTIAEINKNGQLTLGIDWDYSRTTLKHLYLFLEYYICLFNEELKEEVHILRNKSNKKAYIQKLIDNGTIKYNENLQ
jgi:hypothetical protein